MCADSDRDRKLTRLHGVRFVPDGHAVCALLTFRLHRHLHLADPLDAALEDVARGELLHAGGGAGGDEHAGSEGGHAREEADVLAQRADHVARVRAHGEAAVLLDADREGLRVVDLVARDDPRAQARERVETLADVARVVPAASPWIALAEIPPDGVAEHMLERTVVGDVPRGPADHRAQLALE